MPNVDCPSCGLASYVATPHSAHPLCPHCDADLFATVARPARGIRDAAPARSADEPSQMRG